VPRSLLHPPALRAPALCHARLNNSGVHPPGVHLPVLRQRPWASLVLWVCVCVCLFLSVGMSSAWAQSQAPVQPQAAPRQAQPSVADPALEAQVLRIADELRCLVCQNETIAASHADLAVDLRNQIRVKLGDGQTQQQILDFMVARYGDFVLYRPPVKSSTLLLWVGPFVLLGVAVLTLVLNVRRRRAALVSPELSADEARRVAQLLQEDPRNATAQATGKS
jgi:cytochrome c-type biogenesis protein CcmH